MIVNGSAAAAFLLCSASPPQGLADPFDPTRRPPYHKIALPRCPATPPAVDHIQGLSFYTDEARSISNDKLRKRAAAAYAPLSLFTRLVQKQSDAWLASGGTSQSAADCGLRLLEDWAGGDALLAGPFNVQGEYARRWYATGLAIAYLALRYGASGEQGVQVRRWFRTVGKACGQNPPKAPNNLFIWQAVAMVSCAVAGNDQSSFDSGITRATRAISRISDDGSLPLELSRGQMSLHYHSFALAPLLAIAELASVNGVDLYSLNDGGLRRLTDFVVSGLAGEEHAIARLGGAQLLNVTSVPWLALARRRFGSDAVASVPAEVATDHFSFLGGNQQLLFG